MDNQKPVESPETEDKSFLRVIVHSFFIIPFLIAVFCVLLFAGIKLLTQEKRSVYDYLNDVKVGGTAKRWQGAFELSKILSNPQSVPDEERFDNELILAFEQARNDDNRVRQYLALAMGRTKRPVFSQVLIDSLADEKEENVAATIYAIGSIGLKSSSEALHGYMEHGNARIRSVTASALGIIGNPLSLSILKKGLQDSEPNVQWVSAVSLAKMGNLSGKQVLLKLLDRNYLGQFPEVDQTEQNTLLIIAIEVSGLHNDMDLKGRVSQLSVKDPNMKVRAAALRALGSK